MFKLLEQENANTLLLTCDGINATATCNPLRYIASQSSLKENTLVFGMSTGSLVFTDFNRQTVQAQITAHSRPVEFIFLVEPDSHHSASATLLVSADNQGFVVLQGSGTNWTSAFTSNWFADDKTASQYTLIRVRGLSQYNKSWIIGALFKNTNTGSFQLKFYNCSQTGGSVKAIPFVWDFDFSQYEKVPDKLDFKLWNHFQWIQTPFLNPKIDASAPSCFYTDEAKKEAIVTMWTKETVFMFPYLSGFSTTIAVGNFSGDYQTIFYETQSGEEIVEPEIQKQCFKVDNQPSSSVYLVVAWQVLPQ